MLFYILILAVSVNLDAFGVGMVYGIKNTKIPLVSKLIICFMSVLYASMALLIGKSLYSVLPPFLPTLIGVLILIVMGIWIIIQSLNKNSFDEKDNFKEFTSQKTLFKLVIKSLGITIQIIKNPSRADIDKSGSIDTRESLFVALALSIDAIGVGIGSALAGFQSIFVPIAVGLFQLLFLSMGTYLGAKFSAKLKLNKKFLSFAPGLLLILLAILRLL